MNFFRMQWYSSILGGCSSDARSFLKTKPSIKLRFQAAALRVLFVCSHQKRSTSVNSLAPFRSPRTTPLSVLKERDTLAAVSQVPLFHPHSHSLHLFFPGSSRLSVDAHLVETNVLGLLTEALTAQVQVVLADQTGRVLADAAIMKERRPS